MEKMFEDGYIAKKDELSGITNKKVLMGIVRVLVIFIKISLVMKRNFPA